MHQRLVLREPVHVIGHTLVGLPAEITLRPTRSEGWWVQCGDVCRPLTGELLGLGHHHLTMQIGELRAHIVEHLLAIRFFGLDSVCIVFDEGARVPYWGSGQHYWDQVRNSCVPDGKLTRCTFKDQFELPSHNLRKWLRFTPSDAGLLRIFVSIDYADPAIGQGVFDFTLTTEQLQRIAEARGLGSPHWIRGMVTYLGRFGWPHAEAFAWRTQTSPAALREELARHRVWDLLGALAFETPARAMLEGTIHTRIAGHADDVLCMRLLRQVGWQTL